MGEIFRKPNEISDRDPPPESATKQHIAQLKLAVEHTRTIEQERWTDEFNKNLKIRLVLNALQQTGSRKQPYAGVQTLDDLQKDTDRLREEFVRVNRNQANAIYRSYNLLHIRLEGKMDAVYGGPLTLKWNLGDDECIADMESVLTYPKISTYDNPELRPFIDRAVAELHKYHSERALPPMQKLLFGALSEDEMRELVELRRDPYEYLLPHGCVRSHMESTMEWNYRERKYVNSHEKTELRQTLEDIAIRYHAESARWEYKVISAASAGWVPVEEDRWESNRGFTFALTTHASQILKKLRHLPAEDPNGS